MGMAKISELYEQNHECFMSNQWFWKYDEIRKAIKQQKRPFDVNENEVFLSSGHKPDENHIALLEPPTFKVFDSKKEMLQQGEECGFDKAYFSEYTFDTKQKKIFKRSVDI